MVQVPRARGGEKNPTDLRPPDKQCRIDKVRFVNTPNTIIKYKDDLILSACEFRWSKGDKFALIEAIAICAANDLQCPKWVRSQIDVAMTGIFEAVYPDQDLKDRRSGLGISYLPEGANSRI